MLMDTFDEFVETTVEPSSKATSKRYISDEETIRQMDFDEACEAFIRAEKEWAKQDTIAKRPGAHPTDVCKWFDALEERYRTEKRVWQLFTAGDRSLRSGMMYLQFREALISGKASKVDA
jgi:hypothetical protein